MVHESFWNNHELVYLCNPSGNSVTSSSDSSLVTCPKCKNLRASLETAVDKAYAQTYGNPA